MARPKSELQHIYGVLDFASGLFTDIGDAGNSAIRVNIVASSVAAGGALTDAELRATPVPVSLTGGGDATAANQVTGNASLSSIDGKTPALGQQVAAASSPVVLTAAQITTLTPPAAIAGFALEATQTNRGAKSQITDGTRDGTVKAASTLPAATDTAVVVTDRDISRSTSGTIVANLGSVSMDVTGFSTIVVSITGTWVGTINFQAEAGDGTYFYIWAAPLDTALGSFDVSTATANAAWQINVAGMKTVRIIATPWTSGTAAVQISGSIGSTRPHNPLSLGAGISVIGHVIADAGTALIGKVGLDQTTPGTTNAASIAQIGATTVATGNGTVSAGVIRVAIASDNTAFSVNATPPTLTKGTQGATGYSTQDLSDAGRNVTNYFMAAGIAGTNAEVMQSLTGYKGGVAVGATVTPAVVTSGKTYRITAIDFSYQSLATITAIMFRLRANLSGTGVVTSPLVNTWILGSSSAAAGVTTTLHIDFPAGLEFAAGTGIAVGMIGLSTIGAAAASGFGQIAITGYEY